MAKNTAQPGLFGPTASEVAKQVREKGRMTDIALAQMPQGTAGNLLARGVGRSLGNIIDDPSKDPAVQRAGKLNFVKQQLLSSGLDPANDTENFLELTSKLMLDQGLVEESFQVAQGLSTMRDKKAELRNKTRESKVKASAEKRALRAERGELGLTSAKTNEANARAIKLLSDANFQRKTGFSPESLKGLPDVVKKMVIVTAASRPGNEDLFQQIGGEEGIATLERDILLDTTKQSTLSQWVLAYIRRESGEGRPNTTDEKNAFKELKQIGFVQQLMVDLAKETEADAPAAPTVRSFDFSGG